MQYALHDLRRWGFNKIMGYYNDKLDNRENLLKQIHNLNSRFYLKKASAYSSIRMWDVIESFLSENYWGMYLLMMNIEPLITSIRVDKACQRRFKNTWTSLWRAFSADVKMDSLDTAVLSDLGVRLCFVEDESLNEEELIILDMYNTLLSWNVITLNEVNLSAFRINPLDLISNMVEWDSPFFVDYIKELVEKG